MGANLLENYFKLQKEDLCASKKAYEKGQGHRA